MSETHSEEISPEEARETLQLIIDYCEGRVSIGEEELSGLGALLVLKWRSIAPILIEMCGSEEAALARVKQLRIMVKMGNAPTNTKQ